MGKNTPNRLYYGDNLGSFRKFIPDESVDLCYIDPPFNSKRTYNQIYNRIGKEDRAQSQAFTDTWIWDNQANAGLEEIITNATGRFPVQIIELIKGFANVLGKDSLLAYLVSMTLRISEIHRALKPTGTFYLHCDPTASHYLKFILDAIFCSSGGQFLNEIVWCYASGGVSKRYFAKKHDVIFLYAKSKGYKFNTQYRPYSAGTLQRGLTACKKEMNEKYELRSKGAVMSDWWSDITPLLSPTSLERVGYPTQKPETLLERIISSATDEGDVVLDAYCGCGTTVAVAHRLKRRWIGMDITYQSISLILVRLEKAFGAAALETVTVSGIPHDLEAAVALAHKKDDRLRKEFEKWAVLTYSLNRAGINEKKGADAGIDGIAYFLTGPEETQKIVFQAKSGNVGRGDIAKLNSDRQREGAKLAVLITLEEPTSAMRLEANGMGQYTHPFTGRVHPVIDIVTVRKIVEDGERLTLPLSIDALKAAAKRPKSEQRVLFDTRDFGD